MPPPEPLPSSARSIALLLASTPSINDAQPGVLHQLLEFSHRYTSHVLTDALVYSEHAGRPGKLERDDVVMSVQARVGWEFGGRVPKEYIHNLASQTNAVPLPAVPEAFGIRLPPAKDCLTAVDFDLVPNKPPPAVILYEEEEIEVDDDDEEEEIAQDLDPDADDQMEMVAGQASDQEAQDVDEDGLFAGEDDDEDEDAMEQVETSIPPPALNGHEPPKRQLVEEDDYD